MNKDMVYSTMANDQQKHVNWKVLALPAGLLLLLAAGYYFGLQDYLTVDALVQHRALLASFTDQHFFLSVVAFAVVYALAVAVSVPGATGLTLLGGFLFGGLLGGFVSTAAATLGAVAIFQIARSAFGNVLARRAGPLLTTISKGFSDDAFNYLLFLRLVPAFPFWLVNIAPAFANVRLRTYALATFIGIIPATFAFSFLGAGLDSIISAHQREKATCLASKPIAECSSTNDFSALLTPELLLAFAGLGVVALIPVGLRKWRSRHV